MVEDAPKPFVIEDNLNPEERVRVECLDRAIARLMGTNASPRKIVEMAKVFETFVTTGRTWG